MELREYWNMKNRTAKFKNEATISPPLRPGIEKKNDYSDIRVMRPFYLKPRALSIPY